MSFDVASNVREFAAIAAAKFLWEMAREPTTTALPLNFHSRSRAERDKHFHRWYGDRNGLSTAWLVTFGEVIPLKPAISPIDFEGKTLEVYIARDATTLHDVIGSVRLVALIPGNQCAIRSVNLERIVRAAMISDGTVAAGQKMVESFELALRGMGVVLDRAGPAATNTQFADALNRRDRRAAAKKKKPRSN